MAVRILSRSIFHHSVAAPRALASPALRHRSSQTGKLIEIDLESSPSNSSSSDADVEVLRMRMLDDAVHAYFVLKSTPDWLPFIPGSSFWVPPRKRPGEVMDLVRNLWKIPGTGEALNFSGDRGWPQLEFFSSKDGVPEGVVELELEVCVNRDDIEIKVLNGDHSNPESEDVEE